MMPSVPTLLEDCPVPVARNPDAVLYKMPSILCFSVDLVQLLRRLCLCSRALATRRQTHCVTSTSISTHILQPANVFLHQAFCVVADCHLTELGGE